MHRVGAVQLDLELQAASINALAGRLGGIAVMRPKSGEVLALAGLGYSAPQPPGSTFKIITLAGGLEEKIAKPSDEFPVVQSALLEGVELENANKETADKAKEALEAAGATVTVK